MQYMGRQVPGLAVAAILIVSAGVRAAGAQTAAECLLRETQASALKQENGMKMQMRYLTEARTASAEICPKANPSFAAYLMTS